MSDVRAMSAQRAIAVELINRSIRRDGPKPEELQVSRDVLIEPLAVHRGIGEMDHPGGKPKYPLLQRRKECAVFSSMHGVSPSADPLTSQIIEDMDV
jgi:hypothetical protein